MDFLLPGKKSYPLLLLSMEERSRFLSLAARVLPPSGHSSAEALRMLGLLTAHSSCQADEILFHDLRQDCYHTLDTSVLEDKFTTSIDHSKLASGLDKLPCISLDEVLELTPFSAIKQRDPHSGVMSLTERPKATSKTNHSAENTGQSPLPEYKRHVQGSIQPASPSLRKSANVPMDGPSWSRLTEDGVVMDVIECADSEEDAANEAVKEISQLSAVKRRGFQVGTAAKPAGFVSALSTLKRTGLQQSNGGLAMQSTSGGSESLVSSYSKRFRRSFVSPMSPSGGGVISHNKVAEVKSSDASSLQCLDELKNADGQLPERLRNVEPRLIEHIFNEILTRDTKTTWDDIAGLNHAKDCITETIIWPLKRPDLFQGTRAPASGLLLFGPPGTGKTMIGRAIAGEIEATFFSISASSLTSKWIGEGEKLVRALFGVASCKQPSVIFIDEIDSLLSQRKSDGEHESSRRMKTQFLIEMEGCQGSEQQLLVIGATNRPEELDEAARRRLAKRLYIPLPEPVARSQIVEHLLRKDHLLELTSDNLNVIAEKTEGYSGSDMVNLVREASMVPMREAMRPGRIAQLKKEDVRPVMLEDFLVSLLKVRPSVATAELEHYKLWNKQFGSADVS